MKNTKGSFIVLLREQVFARALISSLYEQSEKTISDMRVRMQETEKEVYAKVRVAREEENTKYNLLETEKRQVGSVTLRSNISLHFS